MRSLLRQRRDQDANAAKQAEVKGLRQQMYEVKQKVRGQMKSVLSEDNSTGWSGRKDAGPGTVGAGGAVSAVRLLP